MPEKDFQTNSIQCKCITFLLKVTNVTGFIHIKLLSLSIDDLISNYGDIIVTEDGYFIKFRYVAISNQISVTDTFEVQFIGNYIANLKSKQ